VIPGTTVHAIGALPRIGPAAVCMGAFDGVHRGHLALVGATVDAARARSAASVALVFEPHPDEVVRPGTVVPRLAPLGENLRRLAAAGIDHPLAVRFDASLRALEPEAFLASMAPSIELRALVMTPASAFGRNRAGTPTTMTALGARAGFDLVVADDLVRDDGEPISSARVRASLVAGDVATARRLLGHPVHLDAHIDGGGEGISLLRFDYPAAVPGPGRYPASLRWPDGAGPAVGELEVTLDGLRLHAAGSPAAGRVVLELPRPE
jgi:riboflavin kinase / FMN adenylyltransferase